MVPYQNELNLINAPVYLPDIDISNSCVNYDESEILNMKNEDLVKYSVYYLVLYIQNLYVYKIIVTVTSSFFKLYS